MGFSSGKHIGGHLDTDAGAERFLASQRVYEQLGAVLNSRVAPIRCDVVEVGVLTARTCARGAHGTDVAVHSATVCHI